MFGAMLHSKITNKKHNDMKTWHLADLEKDTHLYHKNWNKTAERDLVWPQLGMCVSGNAKFSLLLMSSDNCKSAVLLLGLQRKFNK